MMILKMKKEDLSAFLDSVKEWGELWGPTKKGDRVNFSKVDSLSQMDLKATRTIIRPKKFLYPQRFTMFDFDQDGYVERKGDVPKRILFGIHPCDIHGILIMDKLFLEKYKDPYYVVILPPSVALVLLAPEVIHIVLGPQWTPVIVPFQVLAAGMLFRTGSKLGDSLARATGAVYRREWRQILYAALVVGGAVIGQGWGIVGVAWFVLGALGVNYLLMAQLSLNEARMSWAWFWRAQLPAVLVALACAPLVWGLAEALRHWGALPVVQPWRPLQH